jgi:hypothetical protein
MKLMILSSGCGPKRLPCIKKVWQKVTLGVDIQRKGTQITLTQSGLTKRIIKALGLNSK